MKKKAMKIISVNVSLPKTITHHGRSIETGIFKEPVTRRVRVAKLNLEGDGQADLTVHGGEYKAVYSYAAEHYGYWESLRGQLPMVDGAPQGESWGAFGENLTTEAMDEETVCVGDTFRVGSALLQATQPRQPCFKLGIRFDDPHVLKEFIASERWGIYYRVLEEGELQIGDTIERESRHPDAVPVYEIARMYYAREYGEAARTLLDNEALPPGWRATFREALGT